MSSVEELSPDPVGVLLRETDPVLRARAHTTLGERALSRQDLTVASDHLREAVDLDPTDEVPRKLLAQVLDAQRPRRRWFSFLN